MKVEKALGCFRIIRSPHFGNTSVERFPKLYNHIKVSCMQFNAHNVRSSYVLGEGGREEVEAQSAKHGC